MDWIDLAGSAWEVFSPVFAALTAWAGVRLTALIKAKVQNEVYSGMLTRLTDSVLLVVREAEQTVVKGIKAARDPRSPGGQRLTEDEAERIKDEVLEKLKRLWGPEGLKELMKVLGLTEGVLDDFLLAQIEAMVVQERRR